MATPKSIKWSYLGMIILLKNIYVSGDSYEADLYIGEENVKAKPRKYGTIQKVDRFSDTHFSGEQYGQDIIDEMNEDLSLVNYNGCPDLHWDMELVFDHMISTYKVKEKSEFSI